MKRVAPAADRNKDPIADVLARVFSAPPALAPGAIVLEIASGSGQHTVHFAARLPHLVWQPTDCDDVALESIAAYVAETEGAPTPLHVRLPLRLDASSDAWPAVEPAAMVCINMIHIAPWAATLGLFAGAARHLSRGAPLVLYGPFHVEGRTTAPSNVAFDASLRMQNPAWGLRSLGAVENVARAAGFTLEDRVAMPANNLTLVFRRL